MTVNAGFPAIENHLAQLGVSFITDIQSEGKGTANANTYFLSAGDRLYMIDAACGKDRLRKITAYLQGRSCDLLVTHTHLDHSANSGAVLSGNSKAVFHPRAAAKLGCLQRNYTEITPAIINTFGVKGFFERTGMLSPAMIAILLRLENFSPRFFNFLLKRYASLLCRSNIGAIHAPHHNVQFLDYHGCREMAFGGTAFNGWDLGDDIFALDTPGHQDDHLAFYLPDKKIMFAGDLISFLNPNDLLDGCIKDTNDSLEKMLRLAQAGAIEMLATGHVLPIIGSNNVLAYIRSIKEQHDEIFSTVAAIISDCLDQHDFQAIIERVYDYDSELMRKVLKINYPRSVSFIDVYVFLYLQEYVWGELNGTD
ncbi:MAG TPA: MBL fold metallo-hydrolase [Syntrophomonas sp.]|nr:MBL fold metallo-hydrolase [Syntrophomonas sp.]